MENQIKYRVKTFQPYKLYECGDFVSSTQFKGFAIMWIINHTAKFKKVYDDHKKGKINSFKYRAHRQAFDKAMLEANHWLDEL